MRMYIRPLEPIPIRLDLGHVVHVVDELQQVLGTVGHVAGIAYIARDVDLAEQLAADDLGEPENRVERRPELVAHGGEELRLRHVRRLRLEPLLVDLRISAVTSSARASRWARDSWSSAMTRLRRSSFSRNCCS